MMTSREDVGYQDLGLLWSIIEMTFLISGYFDRFLGLLWLDSWFNTINVKLFETP